MLQTRKWGAGLGSHQSPLPSYQGDYVCSDILHELIHHKIIPVPFRQPSNVFQPTGAAGEADHVEPGSVPSSLTCNRPTLASTRRGFAHKIVPNSVQLWRRLCSPLGAPPDDDDTTPYLIFDEQLLYRETAVTAVSVGRSSETASSLWIVTSAVFSETTGCVESNGNIKKTVSVLQ